MNDSRRRAPQVTLWARVLCPPSPEIGDEPRFLFNAGFLAVPGLDRSPATVHRESRTVQEKERKAPAPSLVKRGTCAQF